MKILRLHLMAFRRAILQLFASWGGNFISIFAIAIALTLPSFGFLLLASAQNFGNKMALHEMSLFLDSDATAEMVQKVRTQLEKMPVRFEFVPKQKALKDLSAALHLAEVENLMEENPLPDAFVVQPLVQNIENLTALQQTFSQWDHIAKVQWDSAWAQRFDAVMDLLRRLMDLLTLLFCAGLIAIVFNSVRLQMMVYRDEMEVSAMMGASRHFIVAPFYYFGALLGLLGALLATLMLSALMHYLTPTVAHLAFFYDLPLALIPVSTQVFLALAGVSILLGFLAVYCCAHIFLRHFQ